nr:zinc finger, CCHC-type [Tanacetum cinerariifolium]
MAEEIEKLVEGMDNVGADEVHSSTLGKNDNQNDLDTRLEPRSNKESLEVETTTESLPKMVDDQVKELTKTQVPIYVAEGLIMEREKIQIDVANMIADAIQQEHENLQADITSQVNNKMSKHGTYVFGESSSGQVRESDPGPLTSGNQEQLDDFKFWTDSYAIDDDEIPTEKVSQDLMEEMSQTVDEFKLRKNYIVWESKKEILVSSYPQKPTPVIQSWQRDPKAPSLSLVNQDLLYLKKGNLEPEKIMLSLHKFPVVIFLDDDIEERTSMWKQKEPGKPKEVVYSNLKIVQIIKTYGKLGHEHKFITEIIARRANGIIVSITKTNYKNLKKNDIEDMYRLIVNDKVDDYTETGLLWSLIGPKTDLDRTDPDRTVPFWSGPRWPMVVAVVDGDGMKKKMKMEKKIESVTKMVPEVQKARLQTLRSELETLKMKPNESANEFTGKLSSIQAKFKSLGGTLKDKVLVRKLLNSVPKKFLPIVASIEQYQEIDTMQFEEAVGRITAFEERLKSQDEPENNYQNKLLLASSNNQGGGRGHVRNFTKNKSSYGKGTSRGSIDKSKLGCYECDLKCTLSHICAKLFRLIDAHMKGEQMVTKNRRDLPRDIPLDSVVVLRRNEKRSLINTLFLDEHECSSLALEKEGKDNRGRLDHLKQDQEMLVIKIFSEKKKAGISNGHWRRSQRSQMYKGAARPIREPPVDFVPIFLWECCIGVEDEEVVVGEGVVVTSSSLEILTHNCLGGIIVSLIFLEGLEEESLVKFMVELFDEDGKKNKKDGLFNLRENDQSRKA